MSVRGAHPRPIQQIMRVKSHRMAGTQLVFVCIDWRLVGILAERIRAVEVREFDESRALFTHPKGVSFNFHLV